MIGYRRQYFIKADFMSNIDCTRVQLVDEYGTRPGATTATETTPARTYVKYYRNTVVGVRAFTKYRNELERRVN